MPVVYAVVVENEMDLADAPVCLRDELVKELQEQEAVLPIAFDPGQLASLGIQSTGEVTLLVASRSGIDFRFPATIQSGPVLGLRWMSTSSTYRTTSPGARLSISRRTARNRRVQRAFRHGQLTIGLGRVSRIHNRLQPTHRGDADANASCIRSAEPSLAVVLA